MKTKLLTLFSIASSLFTAKAQYCQPSGGFGACALGLNDFWITDVSFTGTGSTFAYSGGACVAAAPYYLNTGYTGSVIAGNTYAISLTRAGNTYATYFNAWVDWDSNGVLNNTTPFIENIVANSFLGAGGGLVSTATLTIPAAATPGVKRMRVRVQYNVTNANNPCLTTGQAESKDFYLNVLPNCSTFAVTAAVTDDTICIGQSVTFTGGGATTYVWNNGVTNGIPFSPTLSNTYQVTGTMGSCTDTASISVYLVSCAGVNDLQVSGFELQVYPNPATRELRITNYELGIGSIKIYNVLGEEFIKFEVKSQKSKEVNIDVSELPKGVYFIEATTEKGNKRTKFVKQ